MSGERLNWMPTSVGYTGDMTKKTTHRRFNLTRVSDNHWSLYDNEKERKLGDFRFREKAFEFAENVIHFELKRKKDDMTHVGYLVQGEGLVFVCCVCHDKTCGMDCTCPKVFGVNLGIYAQTCHDCGKKVKDGPCELFTGVRVPPEPENTGNDGWIDEDLEMNKDESDDEFDDRRAAEASMEDSDHWEEDRRSYYEERNAMRPFGRSEY
jgi:hypothetical protein